ncbi:uncharacterized protein ColSpa_09278 [Colletotrichum spaethianum]|uniref:Uncharacterized protein n=1 Tax=Colletotrichum spaethianum TaxID=700344 RepID=A0AA37UQN7_9PEZI|nr:uncharacterized protein ColSpa_09278 [Colletotrichum spaethianum]GKT49097.1 hypothetical protein ColSpa_09278 [Colletotrichum spaethianum]
MATAIGVVSGVITIFSFLQDMFPAPDNPSAKFAFKVGLDGAGDPPLTNAGGEKPDVRCWNEQGGFLGIEVNDGNRCENGADLCETTVSDVVQQPTYTLFTGNDDAICLAWASVTFPGGQKYATTIGNWAQSCDEAYGNGGNWYYSDIYVPRENGADETVFCAWVDKNGDVGTTGIQLHWPEYASENGANDLGYYCNNDPPLRFTTESDPSDVIFWTRRRDLFSSEPSVSAAAAPSPADKQRRVVDQQHERLAQRFSNDSRLVKSKLPAHTASGLCSGGKSVGPSFVSYDERMFCYMPTKTVYPFCDDIDGGACWSEEENKVIDKGNAGARIPEVPAMEFNNVLLWGDK